MSLEIAFYMDVKRWSLDASKTKHEHLLHICIFPTNEPRLVEAGLKICTELHE